VKKRSVPSLNKPPTKRANSSDARRSLGRTREDARFTAPPASAELPADYASTLATLKEQIRESRLRTVLSANAAMVTAYWEVGRIILGRQEKEGWGTRVIDRLSTDLRQTFPDMQGLSARLSDQNPLISS
jgi:hypothetical protein